MCKRCQSKSEMERNSFVPGDPERPIDYLNVPGLRKYTCTACGYGEYWIDKGLSQERQLKFSEVVALVPEQYSEGTLEWAKHCEEQHTGWYNPYQGCSCYVE